MIDFQKFIMGYVLLYKQKYNIYIYIYLNQQYQFTGFLLSFMSPEIDSTDQISSC